MKRCIIIGAAPIANHAPLRAALREDDFFIYCDGGLQHEAALGRAPDLIVGDFDSHERPDRPIETIVLPCEKDDTDTVFAVKEALTRGFDEFLLFGVVGGRLDHSLGNVSVLLFLHSRGIPATLFDDFSQMCIVGQTPALVDDSFAYFSLLNISGQAQGVYIQNAKYPLAGAQISCEYQYGVSNEPLPGQSAKIWVEKGKLLLIKVY